MLNNIYRFFLDEKGKVELSTNKTELLITINHNDDELYASLDEEEIDSLIHFLNDSKEYISKQKEDEKKIRTC